MVRSPGGRLHARLGGTSDDVLLRQARILRVGFVRVRTPSTAIGRRGRYADPLPRQVGGGSMTRAGRLAGFVVLVDVPADAAVGRYEGVVEVTGARGQVVGAARFELRVASVRALVPSDPRSFRVAGGVSDGWYERLAPIRGAGALARRERQQRNLLGFLAAHRVTPIDWSWTRPGRDGLYAACSCGLTRSGASLVAEFLRLPWSLRLLPNHGQGFRMQRDWQRRGSEYLSNLASFWRSRRLIDQKTYFYVWDEPGRRTVYDDVPAVNRLVHRHAPGVRTLVTTFPKPRIRHLWDGGDDDLDTWVVATNRYYGAWNAPRRTWRLLRELRSRGKEVWSYTYFMPSGRLPQLLIDGHPADPRLLFLWNASEGNAGWLSWQIARWVPGRASDWGRTVPRNPYENTVSYVSREGNVANGDTSLFYPPVAPQYGLSDPTAEPVSSLRLESLRDGVEDADLVALHRERFGPGDTRRALRGVFGRVRPGYRSGWTWPTVRDTGLAGRMEQVRRRLIAALERG